MTSKTISSIFLLLYVFIATDGKYDVYWNVPTGMCHHHGIYFNLSVFNIIQNYNEVFAGETININYHPGRFPYLQDGEEVNGGIPQKADFDGHVDDFRLQVEKMPIDFEGVAVIDFEKYYPCYSQSKLEYKTASKEWVKAQYPDWSDSDVTEEAKRTFNDSTEALFKDLLVIGREMRPKGLWGHYAFPYCHNYDPATYDQCKSGSIDVNDRIPWMFEESGALYPSIYLYKNSEGSTEEARHGFVTARIGEAVRVKNNLNLDIPILPYVWYRYHDDTSYLSLGDLENSFTVSKSSGSSGAVIWGSSNDVNTKELCESLHTYVIDTLGPFVFNLTLEESFKSF